MQVLDYFSRRDTMAAFCIEATKLFYKENSVFMLIDLDIIGENTEANTFLRLEMQRFLEVGHCFFTGKVAAMVVRSENHENTKTFTKKWIYHVNRMGGEWIGHPLVEMTRHYANFKTWQLSIDAPLEDISKKLIMGLLKRLNDYKPMNHERINMLVLHAGHVGLSNTLMVWDRIEKALFEKYQGKCHIDVVKVEEGAVKDCYGCGFETCTYYGLEKSCFYGGVVVDAIYPVLEKADYVMWICPNYNDSVSAKLMAVINRLTALYRNVSFHEKYMYGVFVSANSGNESVAQQMIGALNVNKGFRLPPFYAMSALGNMPGDVIESEGFEECLKSYVDNMFENLNKNMK